MTLLLVSVIGSGIFAKLDTSEEQHVPDGDFIFEYSEDYSLSDTDSFGETGHPDGDVQVQITAVQTSTNLNAEGVTVVVAQSENSWAHQQTPYNVGESVATGDEISVWGEYGDTVMVVWRGISQSDLLGRFTVPGSDSHPEPDAGCSWIDSNHSPGGDLTIDDMVVECDLSSYNVNNLKIKNGGAVIGEIQVDGNIDITDGATYEGDVETLNGGKLTLDSQSQINGDAVVTGGADIYQGSTIDGNLDAGSDVNADGSSRIEGWIKTPGNIDIGGSGPATIVGKITADGNVNIHSGSTVQADVESTNSGSVTLTDGTVLGSIATEGDVDVDSSSVDGDAYLDGSWSCDSSDVSGDDCSSYSPKEYNEY
jgi:cytoskeletal protein CcmA (bactofilin family)